MEANMVQNLLSNHKHNQLEWKLWKFMMAFHWEKDEIKVIVEKLDA